MAHDQAWKDFFKDEMTARALNESEVFVGYATSELKREAAATVEALSKKLDDEFIVMTQLEEFQQKVEANPKLKEHLKRAKAAMEADPELEKRVDPQFVSGIKLLDLED